MKKLASLFSRFLQSKISKSSPKLVGEGYVIKIPHPFVGIDFYYVGKPPGTWTENIDKATHYSKYPNFFWIPEGVIICNHYK
jgi:hypothetical protein